MANRLFTAFLTFSDHTVGIGQYATENPEDALKEFIILNESLVDYDRNLLLRSIMPLIEMANEKGVWLFHFNPDLIETEWLGDNAALGGHIVQTDSAAST